MKLTDPARIKIKKAELLEPKPLKNLRELEQLMEPKPNFVGPGPWIRILKKDSPRINGKPPGYRKEKHNANH